MLNVVKKAVAALEDKKAEDIKVIDIREVSSIADYFIIANGSNQNQLVAMQDAVDEAIDELENQSKKASDEAKGTIVTYVNSDHEIIGRELIAKNGKEEREILSVKTAEDDEFATEVKVNGQVVLSGEGTIEDLETSDVKPTMIYDDIRAIYNDLKA